MQFILQMDFSRQRARSWCFTLNNYTDANEAAVQGVESEHTVYGREVGEGGTPHLQGFIRFRHAKTGRSVARLLPGCHLTVARELFSAILYCRKDGDVFERGSTEPPQEARVRGQVQGGAANAERWRDAYVAAEQGRFEDIPYDIRWKFDGVIQRVRLRQLSKDCPDSIAVLNNTWMWGPTGTGKSTRAREDNPGAYIKMRNKWWDGYEYEPVVILDDIDPSHEKWIGAFLKDWGDHHRFRCEIKNTAACIRPERIIVTSQYRIDQVFSDPETVSALRRRFTEVYIPFVGPMAQSGNPVNVEQDDRFNAAFRARYIDI